MTTPTELSSAAALVQAFVSTGDDLTDRAELAAFLRDRRLVTEGAIPITLADFEEAVSLRDAIAAALHRAGGRSFDADAIERGQRILEGLRVTVRLEPSGEPLQLLAPAVVDEVRRGLARIAGAWATVLATGEWQRIRP
ncbi:ABATE domain-containing protein [Streptomonospora litoralis]|nr:ABATE domain-containing protein [Streptomonospora litoralis]